MTPDAPPQVETVVVRAVELPPSPADAAYSIIRLNSEEVRASPRLDQSLSQIPGFSLFRRTSSQGANPTTQGASLRAIAGSGASRALVTLGGVPQNDPFGGWVIWTALPPESIAGASVVRGAGAGPYGAGALTGVVALDAAGGSPGRWTLDGEGGSLGEVRVAGTADVPAGAGSVFLSAVGERTDGWVPVRQGAGAADTPLSLSDGAVSARYRFDLGPAAAAARVAAYQENRGAGLEGAGSRARGVSVSFSAAEAPSAASLGWRARLWTAVSDLANVSVSVAPDRSFTTLANDQYETPAIGYGLDVAVRRLAGRDTLEAGFDLRGAAGEDREYFRPVNGVLTSGRRAGGQELIGGLYAEATHAAGRWLLSEGARLDGWGTFDGHLIEDTLATGATTLDLHPAARTGATPSARLGVRYAIDGADWLRAAAYTGFRAPTLNELYRPFRVGNNVTEANPDLSPEHLYGAEIGVGGSRGFIDWNLTGFYNRLEDAVTNVTIGVGPLIDPVAGFIPPGGILFQRRNVGAIDALGVEADASARLGPTVEVRAGADWTRSLVDGGAAAPQLTGLFPAETPRLVVTAGVDWRPTAALNLTAELRYESTRYDDDQNLHPLPGAVTVDLGARWRLGPDASVYLRVDNLFDAAVATGQNAFGVTSYGPPRAIVAGFSISE